MAVDPDQCRPLKLLPLAVIDRLNRPPKLGPFARFDLHERNGAVPLDHQIDIPMAVAEAALDYAPATPQQPPFRDSLSEFPERLPGR